jgi:hypothetical protein
MDVFRVEERELLLSQEASHPGHVTAPCGFLPLPSKNTRQASSLFTGQTTGRFHPFRLGKAHEELRWMKDEARGGGQQALTFLHETQRTLKRSIR